MPVDQQHSSLLSRYSLKQLEGLYYIPDYIGSDEQNRLENAVRQSKSRWTQARNPTDLHTLLHG